MTSVRLMFTADSRCRLVRGRRYTSEERVREREEQREADADHRHRVDERRDHEETTQQHGAELRLACRTLEQLAAQQAEADGGAQGAQTEDDADGQSRHALYACNFHHFLQ